MLAIGLMSGTSMDGIDAALLDTDGQSHVHAIDHVSLSYDPAFKILLKSAEYAVSHRQGDLAQAAIFYAQAIHDYCAQVLQLSADNIANKINELTYYLYHHNSQTIQLQDVIAHSTDLHAHIVKDLLQKTQYQASDIRVVGYHGQTLFHQPAQKISVIVGDGKALAQKINITVVNDFRQQDILAGGVGAPLAPIYHYALALRDKKIPSVVINCGGIANVTIIADQNENNLIGFDTGPSNVLLDRLMKKRTQGAMLMDKDGELGKQGKVNEQVLQVLFAKAVMKNGQNYFTLPAPKSLDTQDFIDIPELETLSLEDACATLATFSARSIVQGVRENSKILPAYWIVAGGGAYNAAILNALKSHVLQFNPSAQVQTADEVGWSIQGMEAELFAYLAVRSLNQQPLSFPGTTGVLKPSLGGQVHYV